MLLRAKRTYPVSTQVPPLAKLAVRPTIRDDNDDGLGRAKCYERSRLMIARTVQIGQSSIQNWEIERHEAAKEGKVGRRILYSAPNPATAISAATCSPAPPPLPLLPLPLSAPLLAESSTPAALLVDRDRGRDCDRDCDDLPLTQPQSPGPPPQSSPWTAPKYELSPYLR